MIVRVSKRDQHEADLLAQDTVMLLEKLGVTPRLDNKQQSRLEANRLGFMAEFAVCRLFGAEPPRLNIATDGGVDLWLGDISVDVKFSKTGSLIFDSEEKFKSNLAVLVTSTSDPECMLLEGWIGKTAFAREAYAKDFGYGERMVMGSSDLTPMPRLWQLIMERKFK